MRAQVSAMYLFVVNIIGLGLGPTLVALLTDHVFHNDNMLRYSLVIAATGAYLVSALLWWLGLKPFRRTVENAEAARQPVEAVSVQLYCGDWGLRIWAERCRMLPLRAGGSMTLTAVLLGAILLAIVGGGVFVYRALLAIVRLLEQINGKLPSSGLITSLLSI